MLLAFNKPYGILSQFTSDGSSNRTLAEFRLPKNVYPIGRLDVDSEGLLLLSDEPELNERLLHPRNAHQREYWAQIERIPTTEALENLSLGVTIHGHKTLPCRAWLLDPQPEVTVSNPSPGCATLSPSGGGRDGVKGRPRIPPRDPPIRFRKSVSDCWIGLELIEGKNRQVRRMTAAVGHPTLRLIRVRIGGLRLGDLPPEKWHKLNHEQRRLVLS